jgi:hypothetical protein
MAAITSAAISAAVAVTTIAVTSSQASKSKSAQRAAEAQAKRKLKEAKREIQIMPMQELALDLEGYRQEQEASQVAAAQSIQAAQQGEGRGLAAAVGRTQMADIAQQRGARLDKATEMQKLELLKAQERQEASDKLTGLSLSEAQGAQEAAAQEEMMAQQYTQQAVGAAAEAAKGAANLYSAVQGPYDPTGVKGAAKSVVKDLSKGANMMEFKKLISADPSLLPAGVKINNDFYGYSPQQMEEFLYTAENAADIRALTNLLGRPSI